MIPHSLLTLDIHHWNACFSQLHRQVNSQASVEEKKVFSNSESIDVLGREKRVSSSSSPLPSFPDFRFIFSCRTWTMKQGLRNRRAMKHNIQVLAGINNRLNSDLLPTPGLYLIFFTVNCLWRNKMKKRFSILAGGYSEVLY